MLLAVDLKHAEGQIDECRPGIITESARDSQIHELRGGGGSSSSSSSSSS
jgi:hypothetical protein